MRRTIGALVLALALLATGCGESEPEFDEAAATAEVTANWVRWFDATQPAEGKIDLLEFGPELLDITNQAAANPTAAQLNVEVTGVEFAPTNDQAEVTYTVKNGDIVLLPGVNGLAVLVDGTWKVSAVSYCDLLALSGAICPQDVVARSVADFARQSAE